MPTLARIRSMPGRRLRLGEPGDDPLGHGDRVVRVADLGQQHRELVTAERLSPEHHEVSPVRSAAGLVRPVSASWVAS
ncbi:hypothetical protein [Actinoplanes philippinensis]|uniref:hypothetical protein n=1 Tax=Actinoplanes philippinensis TaxID=35752 RepID=UPI0033FC0E81